MAKTVEVDLQVNSNIEDSISQLKALKRQLKDTAAGSDEFKKLYNQIDDLEDKIKSSKNASSDWIDSLEQAGGPIGALGASLNRAKVATQSFGGALKATGIGLIVSLVAGLAAAFNDNEKAQKKLQPLLIGLQKIMGGVYAIVEPLFDTFIDLATKALPYVSDAFKVVYSSVTAVFNSLGKLGSAVGKLISGDFSGAWKDAKESVTGFSKNFEGAKNRYEKGSKELTNTEKENTLIDFKHSKFKVLSTKPEIAGSGCNFQHACNNMVFVGIDYKFNNFIQAIHRCYRFKQDKEVNVYAIFTNNEREVLKTLKESFTLLYTELPALTIES